MKSLFHRRPHENPILTLRSGSGAWRRLLSRTLSALPPAAAPVVATIGGGLAMLVVAAMLVGGDGDDPAPGVELAAAGPVEDRARQAAPAATIETRPTTDPTGGHAGAPTPSGSQNIDPPGAAAGRSAEPSVPSPIQGRSESTVPDEQRTAAIPPALPGGNRLGASTVPVAETEEEILALEAIQRSEVEQDVGQPSGERTAAIAEQPATEDLAAGLLPAKTTRYVNLRAAPDDDGAVLEVVPALASIEAQGDCNWCAVSYEGRRGYIYKTFISYD